MVIIYEFLHWTHQTLRNLVINIVFKRGRNTQKKALVITGISMLVKSQKRGLRLRDVL